MSGNEGVLQLQPSGRRAVCRPGQQPVEITSGELFRIEVDGRAAGDAYGIPALHRTAEGSAL